MINLLRKHQQFLMVMITILVIIAFVGFYNMNRTVRGVGSGGTEQVALIYQRPVSRMEIGKHERRYYLATDLGLYELLQSLRGMSKNPVEDFIWNSMIMDHEAERLHITPTSDEIIAEEASLPVFQTNGGFDRDKLAAFIQEKLTPKGFSETEIDELIKKDVTVKKVKALIGSTVTVAPSELRFGYEIDNQKLETSLIRFKLSDFASSVKLTDDDLKKAFDQRKETLRSEEKVKIKYVVFALSEADAKLPAKEKNEILGKAANAASNFAQAMTDTGAKFDDVAAKFGQKPRETLLFTRSSPDPVLADIPGAAQAAFRMTRDDPNSDPLEAHDAFYVLHLEQNVPSQPLTFDQAKSQLVESITAEREREMMNLKATDVRNKLKAAGTTKSLADIAKEMSLSVEKVPPFSLADQKSENRETGMIAERAIEMKTHELSEFVPDNDGGLLIYLEKRDPVDTSEFAKVESSLSDRFLRGKREIVFHDWLRLCRDSARVQALPPARG